MVNTPNYMSFLVAWCKQVREFFRTALLQLTLCLCLLPESWYLSTGKKVQCSDTGNQRMTSSTL